MGGGLMQLVAYGAQDIYLTGNPQITFFKVVYRRHTNFSMEAIEQTFNGSQGYGSKVTATISRNGDLVNRMYLEYSPLTLLSNGNVGVIAPNIGHTLINECEIEIGGQKIDKHFGHWLQTWSDLTQPNESAMQSIVGAGGGEEPVFAPAAATITGPGTRYQRMSYNHVGVDVNDTANDAPDKAFVPLQFWFCRNPGLALPLIALQYHEVKVSITFAAKADLVETVAGLPSTMSGNKLWADYIYLDTDERRRFAQVSHEYLIEQLQMQQEPSATATSAELNFNHPVKELIWIGSPLTTQSSTVARSSAATPGVIDCTATQTFQLKLNGHDRFAERHRNYFTRTQVWQHHSGYGGVTQADSIAVYSFALKPEEHQPSGTCNFSRIDNAQLSFPAQANDSANATADYGKAAGLIIYAVNYNVLRIMSGMGGLAYSN